MVVEYQECCPGDTPAHTSCRRGGGGGGGGERGNGNVGERRKVEMEAGGWWEMDEGRRDFIYFSDSIFGGGIF